MFEVPLGRFKVSYGGERVLRLTIPKVVVHAWSLKRGEKVQMLLRDGRDLIILRPGHTTDRLEDIKLKQYTLGVAGGGTIRISVPKVVVNLWKLKPSDELEIILRDNKELVVKVPKEKDSHPFEI